MNGVSLLVDNTNHKNYLQFDLDKVASIDDADLRNYIDLIIAEVRRSEGMKLKAGKLISSLRGLMTPMTNEQIDEQFNEMRDEWKRDI